MKTHSAGHSAELHHKSRHSRRSRFLVGVICIGAFGALVVMAYTRFDQIVALGQTFVPEHKVAAAPPSEPNAMSIGTGHLVWVDSNGCSVSEFDNLDGQLSAQQSMPCSQFKNMKDRHKQSPMNRFKKFNGGFQK